jgi:hypothetical protein
MKPALTKSYLEEIFAADKATGRFTWKKNRKPHLLGKLAGCKTPSGVLVGINGHDYQMGELIWCVAHGKTPPYGVRYRDGNPMNWKLANLQERTVPKGRRFESPLVIDPKASGRLSRNRIIRRIERAEAHLKAGMKIIDSLCRDLKDCPDD